MQPRSGQPDRGRILQALMHALMRAPCFFDRAVNDARPLSTHRSHPAHASAHDCFLRLMTPFSPDSFIVADVVPSPNFDERKGGRRPDMILLHYTGMQSGDAALKALTTAASKVSSHYVVFEDGRIVQCVPEARRAWHAGESSWAGETDINSCSIGIEIVNPGHEFGYPDFPLRQTAAVISLCKSIIVRRGPISGDRILAHSDVAAAKYVPGLA